MKMIHKSFLRKFIPEFPCFNASFHCIIESADSLEASLLGLNDTPVANAFHQ